MVDDTIGSKAKEASAKFHLESSLYTDFEQGITESSSLGHYTFHMIYHKDIVNLQQLDDFGVFMKSQGLRPVITTQEDSYKLMVDWADMYIPIQRISIIGQQASPLPEEKEKKEQRAEDQD
jgi:hypothetical protein